MEDRSRDDPRVALERAYADAEERLGRSLTPAERHVDIVRLNRDLERGKAQLTAAVEKEKRRAIRALAKGKRDWRPRVTAEMIAVVVDLHGRGQAHARRELRSMGYGSWDFAEDEDLERERERIVRRLQRQLAGGATGGAVIDVLRRLEELLLGLGIRVKREVDEKGPALKAAIGPLASRRILRRMEERVPGSRDVAGRLVSGALYAGIGQVLEGSQDLIPCWEYSAVMDSGTCAPCKLRDGQRFESWEAAMFVLPNGGPNPLCLGDGRCRCRLIPCLPGTNVRTGEVEPPTERSPADLWRPPTPLEVHWGPYRSPDPDMVREIVAAERALEKSIKLRGDAALQLDQVPVMQADVEGEQAGFGRADDGTPGFIRFNRTGTVRSSLTHEFGHLLDSFLHSADGKFTGRLSPDEGYGSARAFRDAGPFREAFLELFEALHSTPTVQRLREMRANPLAFAALQEDGELFLPDEEYLGYLMDPWEVFARGFQNYVASKSDDPALLEQIERMSDPRLAYPQAWRGQEAELVLRAFERFLDRVGFAP